MKNRIPKIQESPETAWAVSAKVHGRSLENRLTSSRANLISTQQKQQELAAASSCHQIRMIHCSNQAMLHNNGFEQCKN